MKQKRRSWPVDPKFIYGIFLVAIGLWCLLIVAAPLFAAHDYPSLAGIIYFFFHKICHQIPERSFFLWGKQLAVCSRCTGLYLGFWLAALVYPLLFRLKQVIYPPRWILWLAVVPIAFDLFADALGVLENSFLSRLISGIILGGAALFFVLPGLLSMHNQHQSTHY
ncbi:MAG: DUF2085 domain-containing protein [candidate division KSB1 bacterium]|nr:DUF2085 domain-containing protein [candidate division KSB1 bacterium]